MAAQVIAPTNLEALGGRGYPRTPSAVSGLRAWFHGVGSRYRQHRLYRQTVSALDRLCREIALVDGISEEKAALELEGLLKIGKLKRSA